MLKGRGFWRGKRVDNGEWVKGYLIKMWGKYHLQDLENENLVVEVDPSTLGECTTQPDKHGNLIFEGDIVHCTSQLDSANAVVIFEEGEFRLVPERCYKTYAAGGGYHAVRCFDKEVIGNVYDNPELLEGGENNG